MLISARLLRLNLFCPCQCKASNRYPCTLLINYVNDCRYLEQLEARLARLEGGPSISALTLAPAQNEGLGFGLNRPQPSTSLSRSAHPTSTQYYPGHLDSTEYPKAGYANLSVSPASHTNASLQDQGKAHQSLGNVGISETVLFTDLAPESNPVSETALNLDLPSFNPSPQDERPSDHSIAADRRHHPRPLAVPPFSSVLGNHLLTGVSAPNIPSNGIPLVAASSSLKSLSTPGAPSEHEIYGETSGVTFHQLLLQRLLPGQSCLNVFENPSNFWQPPMEDVSKTAGFLGLPGLPGGEFFPRPDDLPGPDEAANMWDFFKHSTYQIYPFIDLDWLKQSFSDLANEQLYTSRTTRDDTGLRGGYVDPLRQEVNQPILALHFTVFALVQALSPKPMTRADGELTRTVIHLLM